jgi:pSer/pThr/pTyr-binding forkhead associated (FHA) protein
MSGAETALRSEEPLPGFEAFIGTRALLVILSDNRFGDLCVIGPGPVTLGRTPGCRLRLRDPEVSGEHCRIDGSGGRGFFLEDCGSTNGTLLNGRWVRDAVRLQYGDRIRIGSTILRFFIEERIGPRGA